MYERISCVKKYILVFRFSNMCMGRRFIHIVTCFPLPFRLFTCLVFSHFVEGVCRRDHDE